MCANGAFKVQKDLFLDDQEPANSRFLFFLCSAASSAIACVRPTLPIRLKPTSLLLIRSTPTLSSSLKPNSVIGDFLFCLVWIEEKYWRFGLVVFFFFSSYCGLVVMVVVVVGVVDGRGDCSWCCEFCWIVRYIILLWCLYYFIMLKVKIDLLLQHIYKWNR